MKWFTNFSSGRMRFIQNIPGCVLEAEEYPPPGPSYVISLILQMNLNVWYKLLRIRKQ